MAPSVRALLKAPPPRRVPIVVARVTTAQFGVAFMTQLRGTSNARAKQSLTWQPEFTDWRAGFAAEAEVDGTPTVVPG